MSKPQPAASRQPDSSYVLPPILQSLDDEQPKTASRDVYLVYVTMRDKSGESIPVDCTPLSGLPEFPHQLGEKYGGVLGLAPGSLVPLELTARDDKMALVARVIHRIRVPGVAPPQGAAPGAAVPHATGAFEAFNVVQAINDRTDRFFAELIKTKDTSTAQILDVVSRMSGARIQDAQAAAREGGGGGGKGELAAYLKGFNHAQGLIAAAGGAEGAAEEDDVSFKDLLTAFLQSHAAGMGAPTPQQQERPRPRPVRDTDGQEKTGSG